MTVLYMSHARHMRVSVGLVMQQGRPEMQLPPCVCEETVSAFETVTVCVTALRLTQDCLRKRQIRSGIYGMPPREPNVAKAMCARSDTITYHERWYAYADTAVRDAGYAGATLASRKARHAPRSDGDTPAAPIPAEAVVVHLVVVVRLVRRGGLVDLDRHRTVARAARAAELGERLGERTQRRLARACEGRVVVSERR